MDIAQMRRTSVYIVSSPRPAVGKTLIARVLTEFLLLQRGTHSLHDICKAFLDGLLLLL